VCARELGDPGLAALLARLLDGADGGPLLTHLLADDLLPGAGLRGRRHSIRPRAVGRRGHERR
jgi:hypothetical protein